METIFKPKIKINWTKTRNAIYKFLQESELPVDAFEILEYLRSKTLGTNKVTVYRILELFGEAELVQKIEFGEGKARYELKRQDHHHLVCTVCSKVQDFEDSHIEDLIKEVQKDKSFKVESHSMELFGTCSKHN